MDVWNGCVDGEGGRRMKRGGFVSTNLRKLIEQSVSQDPPGGGLPAGLAASCGGTREGKQSCRRPNTFKIPLWLVSQAQHVVGSMMLPCRGTAVPTHLGPASVCA